MPTMTLSVAVPAAISMELRNCRPALPLTASAKLSSPTARGISSCPVESGLKALRMSQENGLTQMTAMKARAMAVVRDGPVDSIISAPAACADR